MKFLNFIMYLVLTSHLELLATKNSQQNPGGGFLSKKGKDYVPSLTPQGSHLLRTPQMRGLEGRTLTGKNQVTLTHNRPH